jgi:hypothetical protein
MRFVGFLPAQVVCDDTSIVMVEDAGEAFRLTALKAGSTLCGFSSIVIKGRRRVVEVTVTPYRFGLLAGHLQNECLEGVSSGAPRDRPWTRNYPAMTNRLVDYLAAGAGESPAVTCCAIPNRPIHGEDGEA